MNDITAIAPHGSFTVHANDLTRGPNGEIAVYVICACGRGYSWEGAMPGPELLAWLANHGPEIPAEEEKRRVEAIANEEPFDRLVRLTETHLRMLKAGDFSAPLVDRLRHEGCAHEWRGLREYRGYDDVIECVNCGLYAVDGYRVSYDPAWRVE